MRHTYCLVSAIALAFTTAFASAGQVLTDSSKDKKVVLPTEKRSWFPDDPLSPITVGAVASKHLTGGYIDNITGIYATQSRNTFFFLDSVYRYEDNTQFLQTTGFAVRQRLPEKDVIFGLNAFYDSIHSQFDNDFNSLGLGAEVMTKWVDARVNYYLPQDKQFTVEKSRNFRIWEAPLEGVDAEVGFLIPGLERFTEVRVFAGYFRYVNPYNSDYEGLRARLEAHILPGVIADVSYSTDAYIQGGHWAAGLRASLPFSIGNLVTFKNPFEGTAELYRPRSREFQERMSDMIIRTPRVYTASQKFDR